MTSSPSPVIAVNQAARADAVYGPVQAGILNMDAFETARRTISKWAGYAPTPLVSLPALAGVAGVGSLDCLRRDIHASPSPSM